MISVCVFLASSQGHDPRYAEVARATGAAIAARGWRLVYGGAHRGLMGVLADACLAAGGQVIGVLPRDLEAKEIAHRGLTALELVDSMAARKERMMALADAFLTLPGGFGTLDELFEAATLVQTRKVTHFPIVLLGTDYWSGLVDWLRGTVATAGAIAERDLDLFTVTDDPGEAVSIVTGTDR